MPESFGRITTYSDVITTRYNPDEFVGRQWLIEKVAHFRDDEDRRHMVIIGEPGSGKSTFLAYLAESWNCPRHFIRVGNIGGVTGVDPRAFLVSLGAQLYLKYGSLIFEQNISGTTKVSVGWAKDQTEIVGRFVDELYTLPFLPVQRDDVQVKIGVATGKSQVVGERIKQLVDVTLKLNELTLLHVTLIHPLKKLQELYPAEKVVILIDALDESLYHAGIKILDVIPQAADAAFPANLRLVMTSRRGEHLSMFRSDDLLYLDDEQKGYQQASQKDIREYIVKRLLEAPLSAILARWTQDEVEAYVSRLVDRSQNNFLYLYYFFNELIANTHIAKADLHSFGIPKGLDEVYRAFALEKIRQNVESTIRITIKAEMPAFLLAQLKTIPNVSQVAVIDQDVLLTTTDSDMVTPLLFSLILDAGVQIINFQTQKAEQLGVWEGKYLPILGVLAVAYEPLRREQIADFAEVEVVYVDSVIRRIKQFLDEVVYDQVNTYRLYHLSFSDYLLDSQRNQDYPLDGPKYHYQIASCYRKGRLAWNEVDWEAITDNYPFNNLTAHLDAAGHGEEVHSLLASETREQRNAWYEAKEVRGDIASYIVDIQRAWHLAENDFLLADLRRTAENISLQCRYTLITSSLNSLAENVPPRLLHFLVKEGAWSLQRGIFYARQISNGWQRAEAMIEVLPLLEEETERMKWWRETLANIQAVKYWGGRDITNYLENLVLSYPDPKPEEIVRTVLALIPEERKAAFLVKIEPFLPEGLLVEGLVWVRLHGGKATELAALAHRLPTRKRVVVFEEILEAATSTEDVSELRDAFLALEEYEPLLATKLLSKILPYVTRVGFSETDVLVNSARLHLCIEVLHYLEEDDQARLLQRILDLLTVMDHIAAVESMTEVFLSLIAHTRSPLREQVLAQSINVLEEEIYSIAEMVPYFEGEQQEQVLQKILREISNNAMYLDESEIQGLFPYLSSATLQDVLAFAKQNLSGISKVRTLAALAELLAGPEREGVLHEAFEETPTISSLLERNEAISLLAPLLPRPLLEEALKIAKVVSEGTALLRGFSYWLASIPDTAREQVGRFSIKLLPNLKEEWGQVQWIDALAPYWPEALLADALALVRAYQKPTSKAKALATLARSTIVQEIEREKVLLEALAEVDNIKDTRERAEALAKLATVPCPNQNEAVVQRALDALVELDNRMMRAPILAQLAPALPVSLREQVILSTLESKDRTGTLKGRGVLQALAPHFSEQVVWTLLHNKRLPFGLNSKDFSTPKPQKRLFLSFVIEDREEDEICLALLVRLAELGDPISAYKLAMGARGRWVSEAVKVEMLAGLAPYLPYAQSEEALQMVMQASDSPEHEPALAKLYIRIAQLTDGERVLNYALELKDSRWRTHALVGIAACLKAEAQCNVLRDALSTTLQSGFSPERHRLLAQLSLQLASKCPLPFLYELWQALDAQLAKQTRLDVASILYCLNPVLTTLRGSEFPLELLDTLEDILRWYP